jgi:hypothetical protein
LIISAALGAGLTLLGFSLGLMRDATVATLLAEKMSGREKIFMVMLAFAAIMAGTYVSERKKSVAPVHMPGAVEAQHGVARVLASAAVDAPSRAEFAALDAVAKRTAQELGALAEYLGCQSFPNVFIVHRRDLDAEFINGDLKTTQGVLVRTNLLAEKFDEPALQRWLVREALLAHSGTLAGRERNAWVLDGFTWWWPQSQHGKAAGLGPEAKAEANTLLPADFSARNLRAWFTLREKLGEEKARQLAGSGLAVLAERRGVESNRRFLSAMFSPAKPADLRGWWRDVRRSTPARLRATTGWTEADLVREWQAAVVGEKGSPP